MNTVWSDNVQGIKTLYLSRKLRFDDIFFAQYEKVFDLDKDKELKILEIGCGPGALAEALCRRYPACNITGIDRDTEFIRFARENVPGVTFIEGDASSLPFPDGAFDVTISNTVQEHVEPSAFWGEQYRVLKDGGVCLCLSARKGIRCEAPCLGATDEEKEFWSRQPDGNAELEKYGVRKYPSSEAELPAIMEKYGFRDVTTGYAVIDLTPDDPKYPESMALEMIEADRQCALEALFSTRDKDAERVAETVNSKFDERRRLYEEGAKQWDTSVSLTMILRGIK